MSTIEIRSSIFKNLSFIEDISFLKAIKTIIDTKVKEDVYHLSETQRARILESKAQIKKGQFIDNDDLEKEIDQWLNTNMILLKS